MRIIIILILGLIVFSNSFLINFLWDDIGLIVNNPLIKEVKRLPQVFTTGIFVGEVQSKNFYRPVQALTNMFDFCLWRDDPFGYHLTNVMLHIICAILLYYLFAVLFHRQQVAFLSSLFFLTHPINVEAVSYISGRADSLVLLFLLLSFIMYVDFRLKGHRWFLVSSVVLFALGIFSKELAVSAILIYPLIDFVLGKKKEYRHYLPFILIGILFFVLRFSILGFQLPQTRYPFFSRVLTFFAGLFDYLRLIFYPADLHMSYTTKIISHIDIFLIGRFSLVLLFFSLLAFLLRHERKILIFCLSWFFIFLIPQSGIFPINAFFAEHFIYLSQYALFFILICAVYVIFNEKNIFVYSIFAALVVALSLTTLSYTRLWSDPVKFYRRIISFSPNSFAAYNNLGAELEKRGLRGQARRQYLKALAINPEDVLAYNNLGKSYLDSGQLNKAIAIFKQGIEKDPRKSVLHYNLATAYDLAGEESPSLGEFEKAFQLAKNVASWDASIYFKLGLIYFKKGEYGRAVQEFKDAIRLQPGDPAAHSNLGLVYKAQGLYRQAADEYLKAIKLNPDFSQAYNNLGVLFAQVPDTDQAFKYFSRAVELDPRYHEARFNLALLYIQLGDFRNAQEQLGRIPKNVSFYTLVREQLDKIKSKSR